MVMASQALRRRKKELSGGKEKSQRESNVYDAVAGNSYRSLCFLFLHIYLGCRTCN